MTGKNSWRLSPIYDNIFLENISLYSLDQDLPEVKIVAIQQQSWMIFIHQKNSRSFDTTDL